MFILKLICLSCLIWLIVQDWKYRELNNLVLGLLVVCAVTLGILSDQSISNPLWWAGMCGVPCAAVFFIGEKLKYPMIGDGDIFFLIALGFLFQEQALYVVFCGALLAVFVWAFQKAWQIPSQRHVPLVSYFGLATLPFLFML